MSWVILNPIQVVWARQELWKAISGVWSLLTFRLNINIIKSIFINFFSQLTFLLNIIHVTINITNIININININTIIADSAQTEYCPTFHCPTVRPSVTGVTSHISHIYKGINAMLFTRGPIKPYIFWIKIILAIFLAKTRPDKTNLSALTNITIYFDWSKELSKR